MNKVNAQKAQRNIEHIDRKIFSLAAKLSQFSPLAGQIGEGAAFISLSRSFYPAAECETLMVSAFIDNTLSDVFASAAANDNVFFSAMNAASQTDYIIDIASEYLEEYSADAHNNYGRGRGSVALYEHKKSASSAFNPRASHTSDLNKRQQIEEAIADLLHQKDAYSQIIELSA